MGGNLEEETIHGFAKFDERSVVVSFSDVSRCLEDDFSLGSRTIVASQAIASQDGQNLRLEIDRLVSFKVLHLKTFTEGRERKQKGSRERNVWSFLDIHFYYLFYFTSMPVWGLSCFVKMIPFILKVFIYHF